MRSLEVVVISDHEDEEPASKHPCKEPAAQDEPVVDAPRSSGRVPNSVGIQVTRKVLARVGLAVHKGSLQELMIGILFNALPC